MKLLKTIVNFFYIISCKKHFLPITYSNLFRKIRYGDIAVSVPKIA